MLRKIAVGSIGNTVYLSQLIDTDAYFAIKMMDKQSLASRNKLDRAQNEKDILEFLDHPFLPTLYCSFDTDRALYLVMDYCPGGDLHELRKRQPGLHFSEETARFYAGEVLVALEYLHMHGVVYGDLRPENVLLREDGHIVLTDFELSMKSGVSPVIIKPSAKPRRTKYYNEPSESDDKAADISSLDTLRVLGKSFFSKPSCLFLPVFNRKKKKVKKSEKPTDIGFIAEPRYRRSMSLVGIHEYLAPEIIQEEGHGSALDWWTFGVFLYELLFGKTPFKGARDSSMINNVLAGTLRFPETPAVSYTAKDLISGLLVKNPKKRLAYKRGAAEIKVHPFFECIRWPLIRSLCPPHEVFQSFHRISDFDVY